MSEAKSDRALLADRLAALVREKRMTAPFGGDVTRGKRSYDVLFAKPRTLDGLVSVFSPRFILVQCTGSAAPGYGWNAVYENEAAATAFLLNIAAGDKDAASAVPHRAPRGGSRG
jgi:hypothetical protein